MLDFRSASHPTYGQACSASMSASSPYPSSTIESTMSCPKSAASPPSRHTTLMHAISISMGIESGLFDAIVVRGVIQG